MAGPVKVGILGAGEISRYHVDGLRAAGGCEIRVVCARRAENAGKLAEDYGIAEVETDTAAMFERHDLDAIVIATPVDTHGPLAGAALDAGRAVLLQKPAAGSSREAARIEDLAQRAGALLSISFMHRYFDEVVELRRLLDEGRLGRVYAMRVRNATPGPAWSGTYYRQPQGGMLGGVVAELGVHGIDLVRQLAGEIRSVSARARQIHPVRTLRDGSVVTSEIDDHVVALYETDSISVVHEMDYAEAAGTDRFTLEVHGTEGAAVLRGPLGALALAEREHGGAWQTYEVAATAFGERQHRHFLDQVRGEAPPDGTARDAVAGLRVAEAVTESFMTQREVEVAA
jgi:predicted dehydrogenase